MRINQLESIGIQFSLFAAMFCAAMFCSGLLGCSNSPIESPPSTNSAEAHLVSQEDYASFRKRFRTNLVRTGPSPQRAAELSVPSRATKLTYESDSLILNALYSLPNGDQPDRSRKVPAVVFLHGGFAFGDGDWDMVTPYLDAGFAVMIPLLRGENFQDGDFTLYYREVDDVLAATEELTKQSEIDPERIFIAGHSAGGTLATLASLTSDRFRAVASFSGTMDVRSEDQAPLLVFDTTQADEFRARSVIEFSASFKSPARLYFGQQERWARQETNTTASQAQAYGLDVKAVVVPGDHFSSVPPAMHQSIKFFQSQL
ncbi:MAG: alpha/beta fold hydrolase [Fuerstiella sp.]